METATYYIDVDYLTDKRFASDTSVNFNVIFDKEFISNYGSKNKYIFTLVSYNIIRADDYIPPVNKKPLYLWSSIARGCQNEFVALLNYDISDNAQSNQFMLANMPDDLIVNFKLYFNKRPFDTTQPWLQPTIIDKIENVLLRFRIDIVPKLI